jgi:hypothetical protein
MQLTAHREKRAYLVVYDKSTRFGSDQEASQMGKTSKARRSYSPQGHGTATQQGRISTWVWIAAAVVGVVILAWLGVRNLQQTADIAGIQYFSGLTAEHSAGTVNYAQIPPVGGDHSETLLNCGIYDQPAPNENAVHSLEHGVVWVTYQPDLPQAEIDKLRQMVRGHSHLLLSPYPGLPKPVIASGWGVQLQLPGADDPRLARFLKKYEQGPQTPERGAPCDGGTGNPIG